MFSWLKRKKTVDDIISESFSEEGRWQELTKNSWTDTKTGAVLERINFGGDMVLNKVPVSYKLHRAFWKAMYTVPEETKKAAAKAALEKLYMPKVAVGWP